MQKLEKCRIPNWKTFFRAYELLSKIVWRLEKIFSSRVNPPLSVFCFLTLLWTKRETNRHSERAKQNPSILLLAPPGLPFHPTHPPVCPLIAPRCYIRYRMLDVFLPPIRAAQVQGSWQAASEKMAQE